MKTKLLAYQSGNTLLHRAHPLSKLAFAFSMVIATFVSYQFTALLSLCALILLVMIASGILRPLIALVRTMLILAVVMFVLQTLLTRNGVPVLLWMTDLGVLTGARAGLRMFCFALPLVSMLSITPLNDLANTLVEYLHIPYCYAFTIMTAVRFVPIFAQEMSHITEAQMARGVEFDTRNPLKKLKLMMPLIIPLLLSSVRKADGCALAAEQRGFYLRTRHSSLKRYPFDMLSLCVLIVSLLIIVCSVLVRYLLPGLL